MTAPGGPAGVASAPVPAGTDAGGAAASADGAPRPGLSDLAILGYVLGLLVVWAPTLNLGLLSPRTALLFTAIGPGLVLLVGLVRSGDTVARWALAFLGWALVAVVLAPHPRQALLGSYGSDIGWVYLVGYVTAWALGRHLTAPGRRLLPAVVLVGLVANALFAVLEALAEPTGLLAPQDGRVLGLLPNSLFLAGVLAGGSALAAAMFGRDPRSGRWALPVLSLLVLGTNLTGSRAALVGGAGLAVLAVAVGRRHLHRDAEGIGPILRAVLLVVLAVGIGFAASLPIQGEGSGASRISDVSASGGYASRTIMWRAGFDALVDRPITGWGPGRFREATAPRTTAAFVRAEGPDKLFYDAHNVIVEQAVTTGVVGLGLFLAFAVSLVRRGRGPLAWLAAGIAATWLTNPVSVSTGPLALLALGAACSAGAAARSSDGGSVDPAVAATGSARTTPGRPSRPAVVSRSVGAALAVIGLAAGIAFIRADSLVRVGVTNSDVDALDRARRLLPPDSVLTDIRTQALAVRADEDPSAANARAVVASARTAVRLDPTRSTFWVTYGFAESGFGTGTEEARIDRAGDAFAEALRLSPWSVDALFGLRLVAVAQDDDGARQRWEGRLCEVGLCDLPSPPP